MEAYARIHEEAHFAQKQLEEDRKEEERMRRTLATREVERFRERVSSIVQSSLPHNNLGTKHLGY